MNNYPPSLVTWRVTPPTSPTLLALHDQGLEWTHSGSSRVAYASCRACQQRVPLTNTFSQAERFSSSPTSERVHESQDNSVISRSDKTSSMEPLSTIRMGNPPHMMRGRMDSDTLPHSVYMSDRKSSVYSTESAFSAETTDTTISDIVEMYRNVTQKKSYNISAASKRPGPQTHSPKAYRDTLIPLMQRRFSSDLDSFSHEMLPFQTGPRSPYEVNSPPVQYPPSSVGERPNENAPTFVDFSRKLQNRRAETNLSVQLVHRADQTSIERENNMLRTAKMGSTWAIDDYDRYPRHVASQFTHPNWVSNTEMMPQPLHISRRHNSGEHRNHPSLIAQNYYPKQDTYIPHISAELHAGPSSPPRGRQVSRPRSNQREYVIQQPPLQQSYHATPADTTIMDNISTQREQSLGRPANSIRPQRSRSRLRKRDPRTSEESKEWVGTASAKRSASARRPDREDSWGRPRRNSMKTGTIELMRRLSTKSTSGSRIPPLPQQPIQHPAIPLTHYQIHGAKAFEEDFKQELKEERRRIKEDLKLEKARRSFENKMTANHRRTASGKSTSSIGSVFEGWKHNLTRSASEKRREKLKASIVVVGPATLTAEDDAHAGMI